jgi:hypothetical protein
VDREEDQARRLVRALEVARRFAAQIPACDQRSPLRGVLHAEVAGTNRASPPRKEPLMELMEAYHEAMATWIITRVTSGNCEGAEFVFGLIESAIRKEATEILLTPVQELDMVSMDFGRLHCYYRQPEITRAQFAYLAIYLVLIGNVAGEEARTERLFRGSDERLYNLQFGKVCLPDNEPAVVIYIEPYAQPTARQAAADKR